MFDVKREVAKLAIQSRDATGESLGNTNRQYRLAKNREYHVIPFGPVMTLAQAQMYQADMIAGGFDCLVINTQTFVEPNKSRNYLANIQRVLKRHALLTV